MKDCLFCKIANKEVPSTIVYEDKNFIAFNDIFPKAPVHVLIIPKIHIDSVSSLEEGNQELLGKIWYVAQRIGKELGVSESGYRLVVNNRKNAGQEIDHLHLHLIGGKKLGGMV